MTAIGDWARRVGGTDYVVVEAFRVEIGRRGSGLWVEVPEGVTFNVSIPGWLHRWLSPHDARFLRAAAVHDQLLFEGWDRLTAGAVFAKLLEPERVPSHLRMAMWLAVSLFKWT